MIWEMLVDSEADDRAFQVALASAFGVSESAVAIVDSIEGAPGPNAGTLVCERRRIDGQFPTVLSIFEHRAVAEPRKAELEVAQRVAEHLGCHCLVSDESVNPYTMILVSSDDVRPVELDPGRLDQHGEYWLSSRS